MHVKTFAKNKDGIALITALLMTMISLTIVMAVMYMITQSIQQTGLAKRYKTALEASYGGTDIVMKEIVPEIMKNFISASLVTNLETTFSAVSLLVLTSDTCLQNKLSLGTKAWDASCSQTTNPRSSPDIEFQMPAVNGQPYMIYAKIVDTLGGNTDQSGLQLEGGGVAESLSFITPQHLPYVYRLEIQAERSTNATEQANMSVLYAY